MSLQLGARVEDCTSGAPVGSREGALLAFPRRSMSESGGTAGASLAIDENSGNSECLSETQAATATRSSLHLSHQRADVDQPKLPVEGRLRLSAGVKSTGYATGHAQL